ncbi:hypothetical protein NPIL_328601 [Nephila pilipes]|uniref:Uncharacterized protein n=1 Tax=Nephila pilipes TaxID=299642 RepID=A0A8X6PID7_NEPPI|nr:hypothetical protein NPIL_328601 [Nephila pilipes]
MTPSDIATDHKHPSSQRGFIKEFRLDPIFELWTLGQGFEQQKRGDFLEGLRRQMFDGPNSCSSSFRYNLWWHPHRLRCASGRTDSNDFAVEPEN